MTRQPRLPWAARRLLRLAPVPRDTRAEIEADLHELFVRRRSERGAIHAHWRLYCDVASLRHTPRPAMAATARKRYGFGILRDAGADLRYAARLFARQPAILLLAVLGLSLGLGIATAAFSIMNAAMLRGEGLVDPDRAPGVLKTTERSVSTAWNYEEFLQLREGATRMRVEAVLTDAARVRTTEGEAPSAPVAFVSGGFFTATGGRVTAGRPLTASDENYSRLAGPAPLVVSFGFWTSTLNRDPQVIGRTLRIGRTDATIVGVAERGFTLPSNRALWIPLTAYGAVYGAAPGNRAPDMGVQVFGRLWPDVDLSEAEAQLGGVAAGLPGSASAGDSKLQVRLDPRAGLGRVSSRQSLVLTVFVSVAIGLVLLLACANVATVLISTAITREREMGVRAALGASRARIIRQLVTESLALGVIAAAIGLVVAGWALPLIGTMLEAPAGTDFGPDLNVYLFLGIVTLLAGVGAGLAPAWHGRGADLVTPLKGEARHDRVAPRRLRSILVMTQAAVSVLLIVMATLFVRASFRAAAIDVGFEAAGLYAVSPGLGRDAFADSGAGIRTFWTRARSDLQALPGIASMSLAELPPFGDGTKTAMRGNGPHRMVIHFNRTHAEYFETVGLRVLAGRPYTPPEVQATAQVAVISESVARVFWQDRSPLGEPLPLRAPGAGAVQPIVIGVVADAITARLHEASGSAVYEPLGPGSEKFAHLMIRIEPGTTGVMDHVKQQLRSIDPQADVRVTSVAARLDQEAGRPRMLAVLAGVVGAIAIVLCVIGLYGLTASVVGQRTREMGVRVAMGAEPWDLLRLLMWESLRPVVIGLAVGIAAALLASGVVAGILFGVSPRDPIAFAGAAAILLAAAALAVLMPTRRAAAVDAAVVLKGS